MTKDDEITPDPIHRDLANVMRKNADSIRRSPNFIPEGSDGRFYDMTRRYNKALFDEVYREVVIGHDGHENPSPVKRKNIKYASIALGVASIGAAIWLSSYANRHQVAPVVVDTKPAFSEPMNIPPPQPEPEFDLYTIQKDDGARGLWGITEKRLGTKKNAETVSALKELMEYNGIISGVIHPGDEIKIPRKMTFNDNVIVTRNVREGDVLSRMTMEVYGSGGINEKIRSVADYNGISNPDQIFPNQKIKFPNVPKWKADQINSKSPVNTPNSDPKTYASNIGRRTLNKAELERASVDITQKYMDGTSVSRTVKDYVGLTTNDGYRIIANEKLSSPDKTYKWNKRLAEATGELGTVEDIIREGRKAGKSASSITREIKDATGFEMSNSTVYRMSKKALDNSYKSSFGYSREEVTDMYNANTAKGMTVEDAYMKAIGKFNDI